MRSDNRSSTSLVLNIFIIRTSRLCTSPPGQIYVYSMPSVLYPQPRRMTKYLSQVCRLSERARISSLFSYPVVVSEPLGIIHFLCLHIRYLVDSGTRISETETDKEPEKENMGVLTSKVCSAREACSQRKCEKEHDEDQYIYTMWPAGTDTYTPLGQDKYIYTAAPATTDEYIPLGQERLILRREWYPSVVAGPPTVMALPASPIQENERLPRSPGRPTIPCAAGETASSPPQRPKRPSLLTTGPTSSFSRPDGFSDRTIGTVAEDEAIWVDLYPTPSAGQPPMLSDSLPSESARRRSNIMSGALPTFEFGQDQASYGSCAPQALSRERGDGTRYDDTWDRQHHDSGLGKHETYSSEVGSLTELSCALDREYIGIAL